VLVRQYGAAAGSLRSAELVTADGRLLKVNDQNHADLFWGLRGGGGNFGIVTSFEFDLYPANVFRHNHNIAPWKGAAVDRRS
jgi:FAD/FMN-containing dehydrogenase